MDEPTASLSAKESDALFGIIEQLRRDGVSVIYISHRLEEVYRLSDRQRLPFKFHRAAVIRVRAVNAAHDFRPPSPYQQAVLAKWLSRGLKLLIIDEPTEGIDIGAKDEIYKILESHTRKWIKGCFSYLRLLRIFPAGAA